MTSRKAMLSRNEADDLVKRRVADNSDGILPILNGFDARLVQTTEQNDPFIRYPEVLRSAIENRALAFLRAPVLISARNPARLIVPAIFSGNAVNQALLALVFGNLCLYLTVDQGRKV